MLKRLKRVGNQQQIPAADLQGVRRARVDRLGPRRARLEAIRGLEAVAATRQRNLAAAIIHRMRRKRRQRRAGFQFQTERDDSSPC